MSDDPADDPTDDGAPHDTDDDRFSDVDDHGGIAGFTPEFVDVAGTRTRYYDVGGGPVLVLIHGGAWSGTSSANTWSTVLGRLSEDFRVVAFGRNGASLDETAPEYTRFRYEQYCHRTEHVTEAFCTANAYMASRPKARETAEVLRECEERFETSKEARIREVHERIGDGALTVPTLYAFGRNDMTVPLETAIAAFDLLGQENPDVRLELFNDCGHLPYREHPGEFARTVADFVDRWH